MTSRLLKCSPGILLLAGFFLLALPFAAAGFEGYSPNTAITASCQTTCHQPERIVQSHKNQRTREECRQCHVGVETPPAQSPFAAAGRKIRPPRELTATPAGAPASFELAAKPESTSKKKKTQAKEKSGPAQKYPDMAYIEAGEFIMGSNERWDDESPEHIAETGAFYIDLYEVTNADYKQFVEATGAKAPYHWPEGNLPKGKEKHPVVYVNWFEADAYCKWKGRRLPNEQEWEKASRGTEGWTYPWGHEWSLDKSNNPYKHSTGTEPVGSYPQGRSPYGLHDMSGNVWEWVDAFYLPHPGNTVPRAEYGKDKRLLKGGSWFDCLSYGCGLSAPTFNRSFFTPEVRNNSFGFRCAKSP